jgi:hypothetical protein
MNAMSFQLFEQAITSQELNRVARLWNESRGSRKMPGWNNIRPSQIAEQLTNIWSYKYDRATDSFTGRLAGDLIEHIFGKSFRGTPMSELYPPADYPRLFARSKRVACEPALYLGVGMVFKHVDHYGKGERIIMPLAENGIDGDGILGATVYHSIFGIPAANVQEEESWFAL